MQSRKQISKRVQSKKYFKRKTQRNTKQKTLMKGGSNGPHIGKTPRPLKASTHTEVKQAFHAVKTFNNTVKRHLENKNMNSHEKVNLLETLHKNYFDNKGNFNYAQYSSNATAGKRSVRSLRSMFGLNNKLKKERTIASPKISSAQLLEEIDTIRRSLPSTRRSSLASSTYSLTPEGKAVQDITINTLKKAGILPQNSTQNLTSNA